MKSSYGFFAVLCVLVCSLEATHADLTLLDQFTPEGAGTTVAIAADAANDRFWLYGGFASDINRYSTTGTLLGSVPRPGGSANDADLDVASVSLTMNGTLIPAGALLFFDGEVGAAEVYAIDPDSGAVLQSLNTLFGVSHVVGGAYHPGRETFFLVQDRVPSGTVNDSVVAEIDPSDGSVLNSFKIDTIYPGFTVNYGDIDVNPANGNLFIVSSDESTIAEFTPTGGFVQALALPATVGSLSGIGFLDDASGSAWVTSSSGLVSRLGGFPIPGDLDGDGFVGLDDLDIVLGAWNQSVPPADPLADPSGDGFVGLADLDIVLGNWNAGTPPGDGVAVPEPATLVLLGLGGLVVLRNP